MLRSLNKLVKESLFISLISVSSLLIIYLFVLEPFKVRGNSMEPTLQDSSWVLGKKTGLNKTDLTKKVVIFESPSTSLNIKRIAGVSGDQVVVNGEPTQVSEDNFYVLGDNTTESYDSEELGLINRKDILAVSFFVIWPPKSIGPVH